MDDTEIIARIGALVDEEHALERPKTADRPKEELDRLRELEVALDQCWDLLRQRRARRSAGVDPGAATVRGEAVVEGYEQ